MGTYATMLKGKLASPNPQDEEQKIYDALPEQRKCSITIMNTERGKAPAATIVPAEHTESAAQKQAKEKDHM
eukprot:5902709-Ditylum_brightwellii.AAC.1